MRVGTACFVSIMLMIVSFYVRMDWGHRVANVQIALTLVVNYVIIYTPNAKNVQ